MRKRLLAGVVALVVLSGLVVVGQAASTEVVVRVGKTVRVGVWADSVTADPAGITTMLVKMKFDSRYLTPDTTGMDFDIDGATNAPLTVEAIAGDSINKLLTTTVTFPTPSTVVTGTTGQLFALRFKASAPGTSFLTLDTCAINADVDFTATGAASPNVVVRPAQKLQYRLTVTSS